MALSEQEQRLLEQMEAALAAEDPKLAHTLRGSGTRRQHRRRAVLAGLGFLLGIAALLAGMETSPIVSVLGFVLMLASTVVALTSWRHVNSDGVERQASPRPKPTSPDTAFMDKIEERWRRRQDKGF